MDPKKLELWLKALRSGEYAQTTGALHRISDDEEGPAGFCCLGVLSDVASKNGCEIAVTQYNGTNLMGFDDEIAFPPAAVLEWAGGLPIVDTTLADMNDNEERSFAEIADRLEAAHEHGA